MAVDTERDRMLRTILVYNFVLVLCLGVPAGATGASVIMAFATIPAAFSSVLGLVGLGGGLNNRYVAIPLDSVLSFAYAGLIIPALVTMANSRYSHAGGMMLATYASVPVMINMLIHLYCVVRHLPLATGSNQAVCPNCQHEHQHEHPARNKFFGPPSTIFARSTVPSTIYTPDDDEDDVDSVSRGYDDNANLGRASDEIDGSTLFAGEGRTLLNQPPAYQAKAYSDRQA